MILANPIYDSVFKYLLEDNEVAKILISNILDIKIDSLQLEPTELNLPVGKRDFTVFRIDFKATITLENNEKHVVLIEIQKAKLDSDIMRFRKYLGTQYASDQNSYAEKPNKAIPIYTIYFLGKPLKYSKKSPIINVNRHYVDNFSKEILTEKEEFIECLTHNSIIIQIPLFKQYRRNKIEKLLAIFEASTRHEVEVEELEDEDFQKVTRRLIKANADEKIRQEMTIEDEILSELDNLDRKIADLEKSESEAKAREEEAKATLKKMIQRLQSKGFSLEEIALDLEKTVAEIKVIIGG